MLRRSLCLPAVIRMAAFMAATFFSSGLLAAVAGNVVSVQGRGELRASGSADWAAVRVQQDVSQGDFVRTGDLSQMAILMLKDKTQIRLGQNSLLQIKTAEEAQRDTQTMVRLNSGRAWSAAKTGQPPADAAAAASASPRVRMETPSATLAIRGTDWEVEVTPDGRTQLVVLSGYVEMYNDQGRIMVSRGEAALAEQGKAPVKIILLNPESRTQWVVYWKLDPGRYFAELGSEFAAFSLALTRGDIPAAHAAIPGGLSSSMRQAVDAAFLIADQKLAQARTLLDSQIATREATLPALLMAADLLVVEGRRAEARQLMQRAMELQQGSIAAAQLARLLLLEGLPDKAQGILLPELKQSSAATDAWLAMGELSRYEGNASATFGAYETAERLSPSDDRGYGGYGAAAAEREEVAVARKSLEKAIALNPGEATYFGELGMLETLADNYPAAQAAFSSALTLRPDDYVALVGRGVMKLKQGDTESGLSDFMAAILIEPRYARAHLYAGIAHYQLGNTGRATESLNKAAELDPRDPLPALYASMIHTDQFEMADAIAAARAAQARMPFLKSLNQVANNQKGVANVGNALAFAGMKDWALAYAYDGYYPYWGGSHLFLADLYTGKYAKNSELSQGFLVDPTVFGASNREQTLIHKPGHYRSLALTAGRDKQVVEWVPRVTLNGYENGVFPISYFVDYDEQNGRSKSSEDFYYRDHTQSSTMALGLQPRHDLRLFFYNDHDATRAQYDSRKTRDLHFHSPVTNTSGGATWLMDPTSMLQLRAGRTLIQGDQTWRNAALTSDAFFFDDEVTHEGQVSFRRRIDDRWDLAFGYEGANNPESSGLSAKVTATGVKFYDDASKISERTRVGYGSLKRLFSTASYFQFDVVGTQYAKSVSHNTTAGGGQTYEVRDFDVNRVSVRTGLTFSPADGHRVRLAYQDWVKPSTSATLGPVDTAGIVLDESALRYGGKLKRLVGRVESEWSHALYSEFTLDHKKVDNLEQWDFTLADNFANLSRLRQRNVADMAAFYAGPSNNEYSSLYLNSEATITQARAALNATLSRTLYGTAAYQYTDSKIEIQNEDWYYLPRHQVNLGMTWVSPLRWRISGEAQWQSKAWTFVDYAGPRSSYWAANLMAYWEATDKRTGIAVFAKDIGSRYDSTFYGVAGNWRF